MKKRKRPYTPAEHKLARRLFELAKARGTLKRPQAIGAVGLSNGWIRVFTASAVTYRDYLRDARRRLAPR